MGVYESGLYKTEVLVKIITLCRSSIVECLIGGLRAKVDGVNIIGVVDEFLSVDLNKNGKIMLEMCAQRTGKCNKTFRNKSTQENIGTHSKILESWLID